MALYTDDTVHVLYLANPVFGKTVDKMQKDVDALSLWCSQNGITMNVEKTKVMTFRGSKKIEELPRFEIKVEGAPLKVASQYKYLEITLDSQLNYNSHIQRKIATVSTKLKQFIRMRSFLSP